MKPQQLVHGRTQGEAIAWTHQAVPPTINGRCTGRA